LVNGIPEDGSNQEENPMRKTFPAVLACCALLLAASITISTAVPVKAAGNPAFVVFWLAPKKIVCLGEKAALTVDYAWDEDSGLAALAPLFPLSPKGGKKTTPAPPGKLTLRGVLAGQIASMGVGYGPGELFTTYKGSAEGKETLTASLAYGSYTDKDTRTFDVKQCNYNFAIKAWNNPEGSGTTINSSFSAEGKISIGENGVVSGELRTFTWFDVSSRNPVEACELVPLPMASGTLTVSGTKTTDASGTTTAHLEIRYGAVSGFPKQAQILCVNKVENKKLDPVPFNVPSSGNPGDYLRSILDFVAGTPLTGTYGEGGHSNYLLYEVQ
jgi:hypothetical protein